MEGFRWEDGERTIRFGRGCAAEAVELVGGAGGYLLFTTERAAAMAPDVVAAAASVRHVPNGRVDELATALLADVRAELAADAHRAQVAAAFGAQVVALGGGRVIDTAKAVVAGLRAPDPGAPGQYERSRALAIPTTLSGAEMTRGHRLPIGVQAAHVRCSVVVNDPALCASQPVPELAASALNALGHVVEGPCTPSANPVATLAALEGGRQLVRAFDGPEPDRDALALGALLAGYAIDSAGYGLHHVLAQTLVRVAGASHAGANAIMLPHTIEALHWRFPRQHAALAAALGEDPAEAAARLCRLTGATRLADLRIDHDALAACADAAAERPELDRTPPRAGRAEVLALYERAA